MSHRRFGLLRTALHALCVLVFSAALAHAQFNAAIQGTILDTTGAVVPKASVTATSQETGRKHETIASDTGFYRIAGLPPGKYTVTVEVSGFKKSVSKDVVVSAERIRGFDVKLELGAVTESVTVIAAPPGVQAENANVSTTLTTQEIQRLPQVGRDPYELLRLAPGVFGDGARSGSGQAIGLPNNAGPGGSNTSLYQVENQVQISANGQRVSANNFTLDGVSVNSLQWGGAAVVTPNQESIQEITVLSNTYSAEDGRNSGAQIKVVSKSGTNSFHGSGFFKYQNPNWNAFNKARGALGNPVRVNNKFRQFGASLGGPVWKDKLFFFFSYEGLRTNNSDTSNPVFVETKQFRDLIASARPGSIAAKVVSDPGAAARISSVLNATCADAGISDPMQCQVVAGGLDIGSPFGTAGQYVPFTGPNAAPAGGGLDGIPDIQRVQLALPSLTRGNQYNSRVDYYLGRNQFAFSTYFTSQDSLGSDHPGDGGRSRPMADTGFQPLNSAIALAWIRTLSSTWLNEARFNFSRFHFDGQAANPGVNYGIPRLKIEGYNFEAIAFGSAGGGPFGETSPAVFAQNTFNFRDVMSKTIRNHALKFGADITWEQDNNNLLGGARPFYALHWLWNYVNDAPIFEAIDASPKTGLPADAQRYFRTRTQGFFGQDSWKIRPNLTLNFGLRYEYFSPERETKGRLTNFIEGPPGPNALLNGKVQGVGKLWQPDWNNVAPRFGFAWNPHYFEGRAVLRGGFGVSYNRIPNVLFANTHGNPPDFGRFFLCCATAPQDVFGSQGGPTPVLYVLGLSNAANSYPKNPALAFGIDPKNGGVCGDAACSFDQSVELWGAPQNLRTPYIFNYSFESQYQLPYHLIATVGYQGSAGHKLVRIVNQNFLFPPNPAFFQIFFPTSDENSSFNALSLQLRRTLSRGLQFDIYYRYSKSIDQLSNEGPGGQTNQTDPARHQTEHGPSDFDATHYFRVFGLWDLPILRGRSDWVGKTLGGWQINGILSFHSGFPWTPNTCIVRSVALTGADTICPTRPTALLKQPGRDISNDAFITPDANFTGIVHSGNCDPSKGSVGGLPYFDICKQGAPGIGRNSFRGPRYFGLDFSVSKRFGLPHLPFFGESSNIELRGNFFNLFNKLNLQPLGFGSDQTRIENPRFGQSPGALAGRVIEFQARFSF